MKFLCPTVLKVSWGQKKVTGIFKNHFIQKQLNWFITLISSSYEVERNLPCSNLNSMTTLQTESKEYFYAGMRSLTWLLTHLLKPFCSEEWGFAWEIKLIKKTILSEIWVIPGERENSNSKHHDWITTFTLPTILCVYAEARSKI